MEIRFFLNNTLNFSTDLKISKHRIETFTYVLSDKYVFSLFFEPSIDFVMCKYVVSKKFKMFYGTFNYLPRKYFRMETFRLLVLLICCGAAATTDIRTAGTFGDVGDWSPTIIFLEIS